MAKILVASIGAGNLDRNYKSQRVYRTALYQIEGQEYETSFMAAALDEHLDLDGLILIGTVRSMWEEAYRYFCEFYEKPFDSDYYQKLTAAIEQQNHQSGLDTLDLKPLEAVLGPQSHCLLVHYGLDQAELWRNFEVIMSIQERLQAGDELYIDITHAFRSLALFQFLVLSFLTELGQKEIRIGGVFYGMLDVMRELKYAPVVDLKPFFEMTNWISGVHSFQNYGNGYAIADLLRTSGQRQLAEEMARFSDVVNLNLIGDLKPQIKRLQKEMAKAATNGPWSYVKTTLQRFLKRFTGKMKSETEFQLELAGWHFQNKRYASGYITLQEAILTRICEQNLLDPRQFDNREFAKKIIHKDETTPLAQLYFAINPIRNDIAHIMESRKQKQSWLNQQEAVFSPEDFEDFLFKFPRSQQTLARMVFVSESDGKIHVPLKRLKDRHVRLMGVEAYQSLLNRVDTLAREVKMGPVYQRRFRRLLEEKKES